MKFTPISLLAVSSAAVLASPFMRRNNNGALVTSEALVKEIRQSDLQAGAEELQRFADAGNGTRSFGTPGHTATVDWLYETLSQIGYYDVVKQRFEAYSYTPLRNSTFTVGGSTPATFNTPNFSPAGAISGTVVIVEAVGCVAENYPANVAGNIALISRGECEGGLKVARAQVAGAAGVILYNNDQSQPDALVGLTLGEPIRPEGSYVPTVLVSLNEGQRIAEQAASGSLTASIEVFSTTELLPTDNVLATTKGGDRNNVLVVGAHTDSVPQGPGINDDGSGTVTLLDIAVKLAKYKVNNAVRFGFWSAEEIGLVGSEFYVNSLDQEELSKIRLNLNYDMLSSPNPYFSIYDGDGSGFGLQGPAGSAQAEKLLEDYFANNLGLPYNATAFDGRSDYGPFLERNIPAAGLFTGAEQIKSEELARIFGGTAGVAFDENYHEVGDDINNLNYEAWVANTKAVAHSIATYASSFEGFPPNNATQVAAPQKRSLGDGKRLMGCQGHEAQWLV